MQNFVLRRISAWRRLLPAQYLAPIALLLTLSFGCLFGLLLHLTNVQDDMGRQREIELVNQASASAVRLSDHDLRDYAVWDEAVFRLVNRYDAVWAGDNLGPYLGGEQGYEFVFVMNGDDRILYDYESRQMPLAPAATLGPAFQSALDSARKSTAGQDPLIAGFSRSGNMIYIFAVSAIVPLTGKAVLPPGEKHIIAIARKLDPAIFGGGLDRNSDLRLELGGVIDGERAFVPLRSPSGEVLAHLVWTPARPGSMLRSKILPAFVAIGLICFCVAGLIVSRGRRAIEAVRFSENRARHLAEHDLLTGLPNRRAMRLELESCFGRGEIVSILYMDLDGFKETNDVYGHGTGDALLRAVALRLRENVPHCHMLGRVGGDEFAIVLAAGQAEAAAIGEAILAAFAHDFGVGEYRVSLGISIGVASAERRMDADELVRRADSAMYAAKASGKHCLQHYDPQLDEGRELRKQLETDLRSAIHNGEIAIVYQTIVCARSQEIVGVEALARWSHPQFGPIPPDQFIPIAESSGQIVELGRTILTTACREARDWPIDLAVNLSPAQFWDRSLARAISDVLKSTSFPPWRLELEITEGYLMRRPEAAARILHQLRSLGTSISLDDFGTGFASIGYLQQLSFDSIKIDRSFVATAISDPKTADLAKAIISIGDALNVPVTAEGIESHAQASLMQAAGCSRLQGWLFGRPMTAAQMNCWLEERARLAG